ncbi:MAG: hypothetical protein P1U34_08580 [Coxiellaceae bacterium]|nr:hypothetical protein [Coxiellaceae bacterium]
MNISANSTTFFQASPQPVITPQQSWGALVAAAGVCLAMLTASAFLYAFCKGIIQNCHQRATAPRAEVIIPALNLRI